MNRELKGFLASKHELTTKVQDPPLEKPGLMHHNCHGSCSITVVLKASLIPAWVKAMEFYCGKLRGLQSPIVPVDIPNAKRPPY